VDIRLGGECTGGVASQGRYRVEKGCFSRRASQAGDWVGQCRPTDQRGTHPASRRRWHSYRSWHLREYYSNDYTSWNYFSVIHICTLPALEGANIEWNGVVLYCECRATLFLCYMVVRNWVIKDISFESYSYVRLGIYHGIEISRYCVGIFWVTLFKENFSI